jgi:hypothetical protein
VHDSLRSLARMLPPWPSLWRCALTGAFGIASGFAVFLLWLEDISQGPVRFVVALGVAVLVSFVFESLRDDLEEHQRPWPAPRFLVLVVLLTMAELFIMGFHSTVELTTARLRETLEFLLGDVVEWHAMGIVGVWLVLGGAIAVGLGATIFHAACEIPEGDEALSWSKPAIWLKPMAISALRGGLTGALAGPLCMLLYLFVVRLVREYFWILGEPEKWRQHLEGAAQRASDPGGWSWLVWLPIQAIQLLDRAFTVFGRFGPLLTLLTFVVLLVAAAKLRAGRTFFVILVALVTVYVTPLIAESMRALRLAGLMAYVWAVPGALLGALTPWLKRPSGYPRLWGVVAFGAAGILVVASLAIHWFFAAPAVVFAAVGYWFSRGVQVEQYWAALALCVATNVFGATHLVNRADFFHIQRDSFEVTQASLNGFAVRPKISPQLEAVLSKALDPGRFIMPDPSIFQSPLFGSGSSIMPQYLDPFEHPTTPPEDLMSKDLDALRADRKRVAEAQAACARQLEELKVMRDQVEGAKLEIPEVRKLEYHARHYELKELANQTTKAIARHLEILSATVKTLDEEGKRGMPGRALYPGSLSFTPTALTMFRDVLSERDLLQSDRQKLLEGLRQVRNADEQLAEPLSQLKQAVETETARLHGLVLRAFEVSLTASSGFWITLGLLASWSIRRHQDAGPRHDAPAGTEAPR